LKISTKGIYGLEAIVDLAINSTQGHVNLKSISERCVISEAYILQIFLILRRAGIVESVRGAQGGYFLAKDPCEITVGDVLIALEGPLAPVDCIIDGTDHSCDRYERCATQMVWRNVMNTLDDVVNSVTIKDLVNCYYKFRYKDRDQDLEYYL